jgi:hypothetical protein
MLRFLNSSLVMILIALPVQLSANPANGKINCQMQASYSIIDFPVSGLTWLPNQTHSGVCPDTALNLWKPIQNNQHIMVHADGPHGSGRYWTITVVIPGMSQNRKERGACLKTTTLGWRTLQHYWRTPLPWLADLDSDRQAEIIIWDSFPLIENATQADYALMAWVYRLVNNSSLKLDRELSRQLAAELSTAYQVEIPEASDSLLMRRDRASKLLDSFAQQQCG